MLNKVYVNQNGLLAKLVSLDDIAMVEENISDQFGFGVTITYKQGVKIVLTTKEAHRFWEAWQVYAENGKGV